MGFCVFFGLLGPALKEHVWLFCRNFLFAFLNFAFPAKDNLAPFVAEACLAVMPPAPAKPTLAVENVRVCKMLGASMADSHVVHGMVVQRNAEVKKFD